MVPEKMKAIVISEAHRAEVRELTTPHPKEGQILVRVEKCLICTWEQRIFAGIDMADVSRQLVAALTGRAEEPLSFGAEPVILAADDLAPSETARLEKGKILAFVTAKGCSTSHTAIFARTMLAAAAFFVKDCGGDFPGEIYVAGVVHEECFEGVAAREISAWVKPDVVVIGESSQCNVKIGQRGRAEVVVETFGVPAHSANPEKGVNAVYRMWISSIP